MKRRAAHVTRRPTLTTSSGAALLLGAVLTACSAAASGANLSSASAAASSSLDPSSTAIASPASTPITSATPGKSTNPDENLPQFACTLPIRGTATTPRAQITDLAVGAHTGYDRIVFDFAAGIPEYTIEKAVPPLTQDPSGLPMQVQGSSYLRIVLHGGTVQLPAGGRSFGGATSVTPHFGKLVDLQSAGDFEAVSSWYVGMSGDACVRVFTLTAPDRLVIDLQH
jgi:hypothetical protein